jgi:hypothetical protein
VTIQRKAWLRRERIQGIPTGPRYAGSVEVDDSGEMIPADDGTVLFRSNKGGQTRYPASVISFIDAGALGFYNQGSEGD